MKSISAIRAGAPLAPAILAAMLAAISSAQERVPGPLPPSIDIKTAPEPSYSTGEMPERPAHVRPKATAPKSGIASKPGALTNLDRSRMYYVDGTDGVIWARGIDYKASFGTSGATYYPLFGRGQAHALPHALSPDIVTVGGETLAFEREAVAARNIDSVSIDRGSFVESYSLSPQSIEQTFVFESLPRAGDLVVHIPVSSTLEARGCDGGLEFAGENGRVTYGRATAIDARGVHSPAATLLENGAITITVDAEFLATATMPLVIDPVITTFPIDVSGHDNYWADSAYDASTHRWLVVYEETVSSADRDAFASFLDDNGAVTGSFYLDLSTNAWDSVHVANNNSVDQFLVVASVTSGSQVYVLGQTIYSAGLQLGTQVVITGTETGSVRNCVVGGDPYIPLGGSYYCVVYERQYSATDWDILVRLVRPNGTLVGTGPNYLSNSGGTIDVGPAVSKSNGTHDWMVVWQRNNGYVNDADAWGAIVHWDGNTFAQPFQISAWFQPEWELAVSSPLNGTMKYLATWQVTDGGDHDIIMALLDGTTNLDQQDLSIAEQHNYLLDQVDSTVDSDGDHFLVSYSERYFELDYDIYGTDVFVSNNVLGLAQRHMTMDFSTTKDHTPCVVSAFSSGATDPALKRRFLGAWNSSPNPLGTANIKGDFVDTLPGGTVELFCLGDGSAGACPCGNNGTSGHGCANSVNAAGASLASTGFPSTTQDTFALVVSGVPPTSSCTFFQGTVAGSSAVFGDGLRCTAGTVRRLKAVAASGGQAVYPVPGDNPISVQGQIPSGGATREYQVAYRNSAVFCTSSTFNISNGLVVTWAH